MKVLWEDHDLMAVVKPVGLEVDSGGRGLDVVSSVPGTFAFHRLDKDTSGIVLLGRSRRWSREVTSMFEEKRIRKAYQAVVHGDWKTSKVSRDLEGQSAVTTFRRLALGTFAGSVVSLIEALPKTGRTHQIRIHCEGEGHPILGDLRYGAQGESDRAVLSDVMVGHALHAYRLDFRHPGTGETVSLRSEPEWTSTWLKEFSK